MILKALQDIINFLTSQQWATILSLLSSGIVVSFVAQILKRLGKLESDTVIHVLVVTLAFVGAALQFILSNTPQSLPMLGVYGPAIWSFSQVAYKFFVKPAQARVDQVRSVLDAQNAQAIAAMSNAITSPTPMTSLPGQNAVNTTGTNTPTPPSESPFF